MVAVALVGNVNFSSTATPVPRRWRMVEQFKRATTRENIRDAVMLVVAIGGLLLWTTGFLSGNTVDRQAVTDLKTQMSTMVTQQDAAILKTQISTLTALVSQLQTDLRGMPRQDQLAVLDRHLSAQDGRMDGIDTRIRDLEQRLSRIEAQVQMIRTASDADLGRPGRR